MITLTTLLTVLGITALVGLTLSLLLAAWIFIKVRRIGLPAGTEFFDDLRQAVRKILGILNEMSPR